MSSPKGFKSLLFALLLMLLLGGSLLGGLLSPAAWADVGAPQPGTVQRAVTYVYMANTAVMTSATSSAPNTTVGGIDVSRVADWHSADVFVTVDISGTRFVTVTPQFSPDQVNWADATYNYIAQTGNMTDVATSIATQTYALSFSADGTQLLRLPIAGEYMRFKEVDTGLFTATTNITVQATLRND